MKTGRNESCPCGSGRKYKQCCLAKESQDRVGQRLVREMEAALMERMLPFAEEVFGDDAIEQALLLFLDNEEEVQFEDDDPLNPIFLPWFIYNWTIESEEEKTLPTAPLDKTVAEAFLEAKSNELSAEAVELIKASIRRPLSFYEIVESLPGKSLKLKDLIRQSTIEIEEDAASTSLRQGEILLGAMSLPLGGKIRATLLGPFALPDACKSEISELRAELVKTMGQEDLDEVFLLSQEAFVLGLYLDILDRMLDEEDGHLLSPGQQGRPPRLHPHKPTGIIKPKR